MKKIIFILIFFSAQTFAHQGKAFYLGLSYYSQSAFFRTTQSTNSSASLFGAASFPIIVKYDIELTRDWFLTPQFSYTLLPRSLATSAGAETIMHLNFPVGKNFSSNWEWYSGIGLLMTTIKGSGGTTSLNNGTGTSTFAKPNSERKINEYSFIGGLALNYNANRINYDLVAENFLNMSKVTFSLMIGWSYHFGGGY